MSYQPHDILTPLQVRDTLAIASAKKWADVKARIPWSDALGARTLRIQYGRLLEWMAESSRRVG